jgi:hypothetical protein
MKSDLNNYLQRQLNVLPKEAQLIESVYKQYIQEKRRNKYEEDLLDDAKDLAKKGISKVKGLFGKDKKSNAQEEIDIDDKKAIQKLFDSIISNSKILSEMEEVGKFFIMFKDEFPRRYDDSDDIYGMIHYSDFTHKLGLHLNVSDSILHYCIDYGHDFVKGQGNSSNEYIFSDYLKTCISYAAKDKFENKLKQYILNYIHVSKDKSKLESLLFTNIYQNVFKNNLYKNIKNNFIDQVERMKKEVESIDRYETRGESPKERSKKVVSKTYRQYSILNLHQPSTLLKLYLHFYPNSNKFEFKDIFQFTDKGRRDDFISESSKLSLKKHLLKRLTISEKEAGLIEAIVKQYVQKKKVSETKNKISSDYEGYEDEDEYGIPETSHKYGYPDKDAVSSIGADEEEWKYFGDKKAFDKKHPELSKKKPKRK